MKESDLAKRIPLREERGTPTVPADVIRLGSKITLHFALLLEEGAEIDSNFGKPPVTFTLGDGNMLPGFEQTLIGKRAGDRVEVWVAALQAFGAVNPDNQQRLPRYQFPPDIALSENLLVEFADASGYRQAGRVVSIGKQYVEMDFNHPLAGKDILFKASIVKVEQVS